MKTFPVITSTISAQELGDYIKEKYNLDSNLECKLFRTGMNHTYMLSSGKIKYVLRLYCYNWRSKTEIQEEISLLNVLKENGLSVSFPIRDKNTKYIQDIKAPEGLRYAVLFTYAKGEKVRFMDSSSCFAVGELMAKIHKVTENKKLKRSIYNKKSLLETSYKKLKPYFSEVLPEMEFIKAIETSYQDSHFEHTKQGVVHMDIWYDNMSIANKTDITIFDFDFCGNGSQILDVGYFCKQLFYIEADKNEYEIKKESFLKGYESITKLSEKELKLIPMAGLVVFVFYLGVQAQRWDWSNIFLSENYLKMFVGRFKSWAKYYQIENL